MEVGNKMFVLLCMIFLHIIDDYKLQAGVLNNLKQKSYWEQNAPDELYKNDYRWALLMHSFSWSFMVMLPIAIFMKFNIDVKFLFFFIYNVCMHCWIDDAKANKKEINLITDQICHLIQIVMTFLYFVV